MRLFGRSHGPYVDDKPKKKEMPPKGWMKVIMAEAGFYGAVVPRGRAGKHGTKIRSWTKGAKK